MQKKENVLMVLAGCKGCLKTRCQWYYPAAVPNRGDKEFSTICGNKQYRCNSAWGEVSE